MKRIFVIPLLIISIFSQSVYATTPIDKLVSDAYYSLPSDSITDSIIDLWFNEIIAKNEKLTSDDVVEFINVILAYTANKVGAEGETKLYLENKKKALAHKDYNKVKNYMELVFKIEDEYIKLADNYMDKVTFPYIKSYGKRAAELVEEFKNLLIHLTQIDFDSDDREVQEEIQFIIMSLTQTYEEIENILLKSRPIKLTIEQEKIVKTIYNKNKNDDYQKLSNLSFDIIEYCSKGKPNECLKSKDEAKKLMKILF